MFLIVFFLVIYQVKKEEDHQIINVSYMYYIMNVLYIFQKFKFIYILFYAN